MIKPRQITVCVDYADILELTLPAAKKFSSEIMIVTAARDEKTIALAQEHDVLCHVTDMFYRRGAHFNKFGALEEALDVFGRHGWMLIMDADIVVPEKFHDFEQQEGCIYTPNRRIKEDLSDGIPEQRKWSRYKRPRVNEEFAGYFQMFHASDRVLGRPPWHAVDWTWAGGADSAFHNKWPPMKKVRPPFEVLHLGPPFTNWCGRVSPYRDGTCDEKAKLRSEAKEMLLRSRKQAGSIDRYKSEKLEMFE